MADTNKEGLNKSNPRNIADLLRQISFGDVLASLAAPQERARTSLSSSATQVHDKPALITQVTIANTHQTIVSSGATPAALQVAITYDATTYVPTLVFNGAVTQYEVMEIAPDMGTELAKPLQ